MDKLKYLFDQNREWATAIKGKDSNFFPRLAKQHSPEYLWIGCSDSRISPNQIINLPLGKIFVHRNIGNVVAHTDLNCLSVIQFAVEVFNVKHIIVCGHYDCSGIKVAMENHEMGLADNWLCHIKDVSCRNANELMGLSYGERSDRLSELNVLEQVSNICNTTIVKDAWKKGAKLSVHGWIYNIRNGLLKNLDACMPTRK